MLLREAVELGEEDSEGVEVEVREGVLVLETETVVEGVID